MLKTWTVEALLRPVDEPTFVQETRTCYTQQEVLLRVRDMIDCGYDVRITTNR